MPVLVTGGAGYIGSHVVRQLSEAGYTVVVYDNLSTGFPDALVHGERLVTGDLSDTARLDALFVEYGFSTVLHFAASIIAPESVTAPLKYYGNNTRNTLNLLGACVKHGVERFIFSSTAAVYGIPDSGVAAEESATVPINPYGTSKLMSEWMLRDVCAAHGMRSVALRYFNVAGADPQARMGQRTPEATHLIKVSCQAALGLRDKVCIFGTDYPTPDGTGIRDYIHVEDLASAHLAALSYLEKGGESTRINVGYGSGSSVREVIDMVRRVSGVHFLAEEAPRRPGDPPSLVARADRARTLLGWTPRYDNLETIVADAWRWEKKISGN
ncbi:UDP-glucose 4-epimerase GalE [Geobacter sulfurreducens]|jgi:UDP-glucose 4-epimerase|uniref:UDP-glucose 4-epimerase n=1 Tax=Geobacter sulfurreducens (strain ATCC 51573 / DSM 12127 / PCA) TaxID=243231 RepID=Q74AW0_GEOSL|nr:UDP-glucose 4-epimerase GalE [Geobacter sulfurreducens]AAR35616.1 UDP-glucose/UDP-N-acetylglucosamine 4-epimerase [Geobacter sulfurreducens PCA]ADI84998.1 UDP-glucose/UDP-N-acetylglucosamine 4-epimerase [Geobacter sulfurreducens KN400]AJY68478.1 UDP-glucose 4-epimerase [Geobacter sulfurreducens]QVW34096.1 UDP-glucose 4-epimerase GalE [Geobacter sulfurreducens]UAC02955.1 UDP-glucose 4-epimerase GalE [Geobacter sulfurreducens]